MKILVTGANGQLGHDILLNLAARGIDRIPADIAEFDITQAAATEQFIAAHQPDAVIHCAAFTAVDKAEDEADLCWLINVTGTENIARACQAVNAKMVYVSTDYVFPGTGDTPYETDAQTAPLSTYGKTKLGGEEAVMQLLTRYFIVRTSWVFGKNGNNFVKTMLRLGKEREEVSVVCDQIGSPTYTVDLARLLVDIALSEHYGVYHATNEGFCSWAEFAQAIFRQAGLSPRVNFITTDQYPVRAHRPSNSRLSKVKLEEAGFQRLPSWEDALKRYLQDEMGQLRVTGGADEVCAECGNERTSNSREIIAERNVVQSYYPEPAFAERNVPVVFSSDDNFALYLGVGIESLIQNSSVRNNYDIVILNVNLSEKKQRQLCQLMDRHDNISIRFFNMNDLISDVDPSLFYRDNYVPSETCFKFWVADIFARYPKVLYVDSDVVFLDDVAKLFAFELGSSPLAASKNIMQIYGYNYLPEDVLPNGWTRKSYFDDFLKLIHPDDYFQAGCLIFNINKLKEVGYREKCLDKTKTLRTPTFKDQCVLNSLFNEDVRFFPIAWNRVSYLGDFHQFEGQLSDELYSECLRALEEPKMIHYAGAEKPQNNPNSYLAEYFWKYAEQCPFYPEISNNSVEMAKHVRTLVKRTLSDRGSARTKAKMDLLNKTDRTAVYTVIIGEYDILRQPKAADSNCDYFCLTDDKNLKSDFWQIIHIENDDNLDSSRLSRLPKILPHIFFPDYEKSIYVDPNMEIRISLNEYISLYTTGKPMLCMKHSWRDCVYEEAEECIRLGKDDTDVIQAQIERFRRDGYPVHYGLTQNSVLYRRHNDESVVRVMNDWWEIVKYGSRRDQLSFNYACWKNNFQYDIAYEDWLNTKYFRRYPHIAEAYVYPFGPVGKLYFDTGEGFGEAASVKAKNPLLNMEQNYTAHDPNIPLPMAYRFEESFLCPPVTKNVRFNPIEGHRCVIKDFAAYIGGVQLFAEPVNGTEIDEYIYFPSTDPQIYIALPDSGNKIINISCDIYIFFYQDDWNLVMKALLIEERRKELTGFIASKDAELAKLASAKNAELVELAAAKNAELVELAAAQKIQLSDFAARNDRLIALKDYMLTETISTYENAFFWKITKPGRWLVDRMKNVSGLRLAIKAMKLLKQFGFKHTWRKLCNRLDRTSHAKYKYVATAQSDPTLSRKLPIPKHTESVDIIICVHNAYDDVKSCIESVFEYTSLPYGIIIVDDGSAEQTRNYLAEMDAVCPNITRIRNEQGNGYCIAANIGMRASHAQYMILLNSDTIVTEGWVDKLIACAKSDPYIGVVGPLSNTASWQSIPEIFDDEGDWCHNPLPEGYTVEKYGELIESISDRVYPQVPLINGFCMMVTRDAVNRVGHFDEENFGPGFGEEDDFNLRVGKVGMKLAVSDDTFIYHAQSKSYSDKRRKELSKESGRKLRSKHGDELLDNSVYVVRNNFILEGIRARVSTAVECERIVVGGLDKYEGKRLLVLLPIGDAGGGGNIIIQEACAMQRMGVDVWLYNLKKYKTHFETAYPSLSLPVLYGDGESGFIKYADRFDAVCCTLYSGVRFCNFSVVEKPPKVIYYIQDFEPYFFDKNDKRYTIALESYSAVDGLIRITKTEWNASEVKQNCGVECRVIGPSVNINLFRPRKMFINSNCVRICAMVRPASPRRAPELTMRVLNTIKKEYGARVSISVFGCTDYEIAALNAPKDFEFDNIGVLNPEQMAVLLSTQDIFADFSVYQAMGLTALEAMASGCAVIVPKEGGTGCYAVNGKNCLIVDTSSFEECFGVLARLIKDEDLRNRLAFRAISDACSHYPEKCAIAFLNAVFGGEMKS